MKSSKSRITHIVLAAAIMLCAAILAACSKDAGGTGNKPGGTPDNKPSATHGSTYYLYNEADRTYDEHETIFIDGEKCSVHISGEDGMKDLDIDGTLTYDGNKISGNCGIIVTKLSDFLDDDGLKDFYDELGVTKLDLEFSANIKCEFEGIKYSNNVVVTKQTMKIQGFTGILSMLNMSQSSSTREVYCKKGETPDYSVKITLDCNGGTYNGKSTVVMRTDMDGWFEYKGIKPTREGYAFYGFARSQDGSHSVVFDRVRYEFDTTIYAQWRELINVTVDINSSEYRLEGDSVIQVGKGMYLSVEKLRIVPTVDNPTTRFKGWYDGETLCFKRLNFAEYFQQDVSLKAEWYTASEVNNYNNKLSDFGSSYDFVIHFLPKHFCVECIGHNGSVGLDISIYSVKNGQKDVLLGRRDVYDDTDRTGYIIPIRFSDRTYRGDVCIQISSFGTFVCDVMIPQSDLTVYGDHYHTHIFLDEADLTTYRTKW